MSTIPVSFGGGGHDVLSEHILTRYRQTLQHVQDAIELADLAILYGTSDEGRQGISGLIDPTL
ncbi:hypothetical protein [Limnohabitans sp. DM1]|uniref:hypothetical protein n=1 Tax=Limnohabitans sp. DM1 TaxID=1597955 RepID=UPI001892C4CC|nr:hypothetical protein [Limnohabitans sp. DM1]